MGMETETGMGTETGMEGLRMETDGHGDGDGVMETGME